MEADIMTTATKTEELIAHLEATTMTVRIGADEGLELPEKIRRAAGLADGDTVYAEVIEDEDGCISVRLRKIDPEQIWGWTPESQAAIRESEANYAAGRSTVYESGEEFLSALEAWSKNADVRGRRAVLA
jgi:hypothetical protein